MRILFIDFDGVLHALTGPASDMKRFCWAGILERLLTPSLGVSVVIHASARDHSAGDFLASQMGVLGQRAVDVVPPRMGRWAAIRDWLERHPEVTDYRILDDAPDEFPLGLPQLIVCSPRAGISDADVQKRVAHWIARE